MTRTRPNVVLIVLDSVRRDHLSCYGYERRTTPNIDRIAGAGILFTRASACSCWTLPSHASLFTGLYPSEHRADFDTRRLSTRHATLAAYLKDRGYATACFSCNGFVSQSTGLTRGFEVDVDVERLVGGGRGLRARVSRGLHRRWRRVTRRDRGARSATNRALAWLRRRRTSGEPFFLFMNFMECHLPYRLRTRERHRFVARENVQNAEAIPQDPFAAMAGRLAPNERDAEHLRSLYDGCLYYADKQVGRLTAALAESGLADRTLFIVTSDHGESFGEHGLLDHQYGLYEHLLAVPLVLRLPGGRRAGESDDRLAQHVDLFATVADLLGENTSARLGSGCSLLGRPKRDAAFAEYLVPNLSAFKRRFPDADVRRFDVALRSVRVDGHKLIARSDRALELYDLEADPSERRDIAERSPALVSKLKRRLNDELGAWWRAEADPFAAPEMEAVTERLEALGYL